MVNDFETEIGVQRAGGGSVWALNCIWTLVVGGRALVEVEAPWDRIERKRKRATNIKTAFPLLLLLRSLLLMHTSPVNPFASPLTRPGTLDAQIPPKARLVHTKTVCVPPLMPHITRERDASKLPYPTPTLPHTRKKVIGPCCCTFRFHPISAHHTKPCTKPPLETHFTGSRPPAAPCTS